MASKTRVRATSGRTHRKEEWDGIIRGYASTAHSLIIRPEDIVVTAEIGTNKKGKPEFSIIEMNSTAALCVFKILNAAINARERTVQKRGLSVRRNGEKRKTIPNVKLRFRMNDDISDKYRKKVERDLTKPIEEQSEKDDSSSEEETKVKKSKSRSKKTSSEGEEEEVQSPVQSKRRKHKEHITEEEFPVAPPVPDPEEKKNARSPVRVIRSRPIDNENPVIETVVRTTYDNGDVEESTMLDKNPHYRPKLLSPGNVRKTKDLLLSGRDMPRSIEDLELIPDTPEEENDRRDQNLFRTRPYYEGRRKVAV